MYYIQNYPFKVKTQMIFFFKYNSIDPLTPPYRSTGNKAHCVLDRFPAILHVVAVTLCLAFLRAEQRLLLQMTQWTLVASINYLPLSIAWNSISSVCWKAHSFSLFFFYNYRSDLLGWKDGVQDLLVTILCVGRLLFRGQWRTGRANLE